MNAFDLLNSPLDGSNLIEASAGTGKTYATVGIFIRLILEHGLAPQDILVVTYTTAATEELRDRVRNALKDANEAFSQGASPDPFLNCLLQKARQEEQYGQKQRLLANALRNIEEASILTIHGFCLRMLQEYALESRTSFNAELVPNEETIRRDFIHSFWRKHFYHGAAYFVAYALRQNITPAAYESLLQKIPSIAPLRLLPDISQPDAEKMEEQASHLNSLFGSLRQAWFQEKDQLEKLLRQAGLNKRTYGAKIHALLQQLNLFFTGETLIFPPVPDLDKVASSILEKNTNKGQITPKHPFFNRVDEFLTAAENFQRLLDHHLLFLKREMMTTAKSYLSAQKERQELLSYDDLLQRLQQALTETGGRRLTEKIRNRFKAVLIDEFQDTDIVQYSIFQHLFLRDEDKKQRPFFVIGDPKQAIYAFRGADIFAYLHARRNMQHIYTLTENWRSEPELIQAVNTLFGLARKPFLYNDIHYYPASAANQPDRDYLTIDGARESPFQLWFLPQEEKGDNDSDEDTDASSKRPPQGTSLENSIAWAVTSEISRLIRLGLENRAMLGTRPLRPQDIAVLVRTNREAGLISNVLSQWDIPHSVSSQENVFHSLAAEDLQRILPALANPQNQSMLHGALTTTLMARNGAELASLSPQNREDIQQRFHGYHALWLHDGFIRMFRGFLEQEKLYSGILELRQGERHLTNLLHLGELLHQASIKNHLSVHELMDWFNERMESRETLPEEYELRLERDDKTVRIVTIHKSKGLEYPVTFCPFSWKAGRQGKNPPYALYHDPDHSFHPVLDLGSGQLEEHYRLFREESLAEEARLLYVALTRARHRVYYVGCRNKNSFSSRDAYILHQTPEMDAANLVTEVQNRYKQLNNEDFLRDLEKIAVSSGQTIALATLPETEPAYLPHPRHDNVLVCRHCNRAIETNWHVTSYTALMATIDHNRPTPDDAPWDSDLAEEKKATDITDTDAPSFLSSFSFPGGIRAGLFFHDIFRLISYQNPAGETSQTVMKKVLRQYNYPDEWIPIIKEMVKDVITAPLPVSPAKDKFLTLSAISEENRQNEVAFYFPLKKISSGNLQRLLLARKEFSPGQIMTPGNSKRLQFSAVEGFLKGFIDLIFRFENRFYLADWKSNLLGPDKNDYRGDMLIKHMAQSGYTMQYLLYSLAMHLYLSFRLTGYSYEKHFGGVYYLFLRGMKPDSHTGIFYDRPSLALLEEMRETMVRMPDREEQAN